MSKSNIIFCFRAVVSILILSTLSACGDGASVSNGNSGGTNANTPATSLTFSNPTDIESNSVSEDGVLGRTLAASSTGTTRLDELQILVFGPMCSGCHFGGGNELPSVFNFTTADATYSTLYNQPSITAPTRTLVIPGNANDSYLMSKLLGTQSTGSRMPLRAQPLSDELIQSVEEWINAGAAR